MTHNNTANKNRFLAVGIQLTINVFLPCTVWVLRQNKMKVIHILLDLINLQC